MILVALVSGTPAATLEASGAFGRHLVPPWQRVERRTAARYVPFGGGAEAYSDLALTAMTLLLTVYAWRIVPRPAAAWSSSVLGVVASTGTLVSVPRYCLGLYPAFARLAVVARRVMVWRVYMVGATILSAILLLRFAPWYWVG